MATKTVKPNELADAINEDFEALFRAFAVEASNRIIDRTPKESGAAAASVVAAVNGDATNQYSKENTDYNKRKLSNQEEIKKAKMGDVVNIVITAPYGAVLENGSSEQAPNGMLLLTGEETTQIVNQVKDNLDRYKN